jgi:hypothetical protein
MLEDLDLSGLHLRLLSLGSKEIFATLYRHYETLNKVVSLLKCMRESPEGVEAEGRKVEELFCSKLRIKSPWGLSLNVRVEKGT